MELLMDFNDGESVVDVYYAQLKSGKYVIKFDIDSSYFRIITKKQFDVMSKSASTIVKEVNAATLKL